MDDRAGEDGVEDPPLRVGYAEVELTPPIGGPLAGVMARRGRFSRSVRDPLFARALYLAAGPEESWIVTADLLVITERLQQAVAARAGVDPAALLLSATHTHSGPGGYWDAGRAELIMGRFEAAALERLVASLARAIAEARSAPTPARVRAGSVELAGVSANRRRRLGPVDPELSLVRFETEAGPPIDLVSFGAHPVVGSERAPETVSADYPGELCRRLARRGRRPLYLNGAVGGLSPLFPEFPLDVDRHLELLGDLLERGVDRAERVLRPVGAAFLRTDRIGVALPRPSCRIFTPPGARWRLADLVATPVRWWLTRMAVAAREGDHAWLGLVRLGSVAWLGTPCDLGVGVALALKAELRRAGVDFPLVGSHCSGYVGYVHLPEDYACVPERGFRELAFYENAMSLGGRDLGERFVAAVADALAWRGAAP